MELTPTPTKLQQEVIDSLHPVHCVILRNKVTNQIYQHLEDDRFKNLTTGATGTVTPDQGKTLVVNYRLSKMANANPALLTLINKLQLSYEPE